MSNVTISPNMGMPVPVVGEEPGPDWATDINASLSVVDSHNHTAGQGVAITPSAMNINSDLSFAGTNATGLKTVVFNAQSNAPSGGIYLGCLYVLGSDLYFNDEAGNQVRITQSGSVAGATGTITGLPSGTASASYSAGTFTFQSATNTPATMAVGPVAIGSASVSPHTTTVASAVTQASNISLTLPTASPANNTFMGSDASGNLSWVTSTGSGSVVRATSPTITTPVFSGKSTGTLTGDTFAPTVTWSDTVTVTSSSWFYTQTGNTVSAYGVMRITTTPGADFVSVTVPIPTADLTCQGICYFQNESTPSVAPTAAMLAQSGTTLITPPFNVPHANGGVTTRFMFSFTYKAS